MNTRRRRFGGAESSSEDSEGLLPGGLTNVHHKSPQKTKWSSYIPLLAVFTVYVALLVAIFWHFPVIDESHRSNLKLPQSLEEVFKLHRVLQQYTVEHYKFLLITYTLVFIFLQTFAIPGSMPLTVLGGALFQTPVGATVSTICTAIGSSFCYQLSRVFGRQLVNRYLLQQTRWLRSQVGRHNDHLFQYIFAMRLTPVFPGWFLNIVAPHIGVRLGVFFCGSMAGIFPTTLIYSQAGSVIDSWSFNDYGGSGGSVRLFTPGNIVFMLICFAVVILGKRMKSRFLADV